MKKIKNLLKKGIILITLFFIFIFFTPLIHAQNVSLSPSAINQTNQADQSLNLLLEFLKIFFSSLNLSSGEGSFSYSYPTTPSQSTSAYSPSTNKLDYFIPFRDSTIKPKSNAKQLILNSWPNCQIQYFDLIISESVAHQWNPAFVLALWVEETGASTRTKKENGGSGISAFPNGPLARGHLGCAPSKDQTIEESLQCLFKNFSNFTNEQFAQFMARYSGGPPEDPFANNPNFPKNIRYWYSILASANLVLLTPTPSSLKTSYQYFAQCDASPERNWKNKPLPNGCTICEAGCGPTTVAMIVGSFIDSTIDPVKVVNIYKNNNYYAGCRGTRWDDAIAILKSFGLKTTTRPFVYNPPQPAEKIVKDIAPYINEGWTFFTLANFCQTGCGHFFWIVDVDERDNSVLTYDPAYGNGKSLPFNVTYGLSSKYRGFPLYRRLIGVKL